MWERLKAYEDTGLTPEDLKGSTDEKGILELTAAKPGTSQFFTPEEVAAAIEAQKVHPKGKRIRD